MIENRKYTRYDKKIEVEYSTSDNDIISNTTGKIINISLGGMYIITDLLVEKNSKLNLNFSFVENDELIILKNTGTVLRSGEITSDSDLNANYNLLPSDGKYYAAIKFLEPFMELSLYFQA